MKASTAAQTLARVDRVIRGWGEAFAYGNAGIKPKSLDDVPFVLKSGLRFVRSNGTVTISTDGALARNVRRKGKDQGAGGWAFVAMAQKLHNQMELRAAIEALKHVQANTSFIIRTDL